MLNSFPQNIFGMLKKESIIFIVHIFLQYNIIILQQNTNDNIKHFEADHSRE